jgi:N6-L-threonylcarbamoyladenine synthase
MQAHVLANLIDDPKPGFPFLSLTVSGGHTQIVRCNSPLDMEVLGETIDDAAGEAFDKSAKLLGLPYPGGPLIDKYAKTGNRNRFTFPEPQVPGFDFSFSGLKTSILYFLQNAGAGTVYHPEAIATEEERTAFIRDNIADICASIQHRIVTILLKKLRKAARETGIRDICLAGGVSANSELRSAFLEIGEKENWRTFIPAFQYCTDNAGMIAITAYYKYLAGQFAPFSTTASARASWQ